MPPRKQPKKRRSGRKLLAFIVAAGLLAFGWVHIVHGSSAKRPAHRRPVACRAQTGRRAQACMARFRHASRQASAASTLRVYAGHLVPVLKRSRSAFDGAAAAVQQTDLGTLDSICGTYGNQITILADEADGVPHPGAWYQPVSRLHHSVLGLFHDMQGALQMCQTASENGDPDTAAVARNDVATAAEQLRSTDDYTVSLSRRK